MLISGQMLSEIDSDPLQPRCRAGTEVSAYDTSLMGPELLVQSWAALFARPMCLLRPYLLQAAAYV